MKNNFNFLQVANWIYIIRSNLKDFRVRLDKEKINKDPQQCQELKITTKKLKRKK